MKLVGHIKSNACIPGISSAGSINGDAIKSAEYIGDGIIKITMPGNRNGKPYGHLVKDWSSVEWEDEPPVQQGKK